ncbi:uncharacterized protein H6S33_003489 [Morchella sextelata]|uniref:uncharacterized protein n=1 Tax=Morchella sextelata TaxID=1174677 RepID=UPI001D0417C5|nr:uncharacterized protein H6S33_003489 [Morchella sextelata]KAH0606655.1 hypothetical protein H6S33_003489 [Morchella sextelata]
MPPPPPNIDTLLSHFRTSLNLHLRPTWLSHTLTTQRLPTGAALLASLKFRILASDITESLQPHANLCFPPSIHDTDTQAQVLVGPIAVQIVAVEDVGLSRVEQLDRLEMAARGEVVRGREVIRVLPEEDGEAPRVVGRAGKTGPCKVLVEDAGGRRVYAVELEAVEGVKSDMAIGAKMVLKDVTAARGLLLLTPGNTTFLGGKIEVLNLAWVEGRRQALQSAIEQLRS